MIKILIAAIAWSVLVSSQGTRTPFPCHSDVCNLYGQDQFCSERESRCRDCLDIIDGCFEPETPSNCTRTCIEFHVQEKLKNERASACPELGPIENGKSNDSTSEIYKPGDVIGITCDAGYRLFGRPTLKCKAYGQWSHDVPTCEEITCPVLPEVGNGKHNGSLTIPHKPGDIVTVLCNHGYQRIGPVYAVCQTNGAWQTQLSICQKYPEIPPIKNGRWDRTMVTNNLESDELQATCDRGYTLLGSGNLRWSKTGIFTSSNGHLSLCKKDEETNVWMIVAITEGVLLLVLIVCLVICKVYKYQMKQRQNQTKKTVRDSSKENGNKKETRLLIDSVEKQISNPCSQSGYACPNKDISLHDQKLQRESGSKESESQSPMNNLYGDQPDMVINSISTGTRVPSEVQKKIKDAAVTREIDRENDCQSSKSYVQIGRNPDAGNNMHVSINITGNNTTDNNVIVGSGTDATSSKSTNTTAPSTADGQTADKRMNDLKLPVEESATYQPSQPESASPEPEASTVLKEVRNGTAIMNDDSYAASRPLNGLAIQQNANNEQDIARKLGLANGNVNTDDLENHEVTKF
ncbi:uncharacterized protein LOC132734886 isoform X2 [Ruditapes philippinarum]|nr:uncharacterized protein LOC132734886 isoform X2 [Ruditapes philippinarum]XP_060577736.1 uncharacterized protein LOC132734886 isoform X2 [Ruditapes philippinarum]